MTIKEAHEGLLLKKFSAKELTLSCLRRIDKIEDRLNAFITVTAELALEHAKKVDKKLSAGNKLSLLAGIPLTLKDIYCTKEIETTASSNILKGFIPPYDATTVKALKEQAAVILGKTNCDAFAHGASGENSDFGPTRNPWDLERVSGGSSSGSAAAVSSGECLYATATDTGGSIRFPAAFCNLVGIKPTYGRVSRYGIIAMASSLDSPGVLAKTVFDCALVLNYMAGHDYYDSTTPDAPVPDYTEGLGESIKGFKIGIPREYFIKGLANEIEEKVKEAIKKFASFGAEIIEVSLPHTKYAIAAYYIIVPSEISSNLARYDGIKYGFSDRKGKDLSEIYYNSRGKGFGDEAKRRIMLGTYALSAGYYEAYYDKAQRVRTLIKEDFAKAFKIVDVLIAPVTPDPPFKLGEKTEDPLKMYLEDVFTAPINLSGIPSLALPCGFTKNNLPVGMQIIGPQFSEKLLFKVGYLYEQATDWHKMRPVISEVGPPGRGGH